MPSSEPQRPESQADQTFPDHDAHTTPTETDLVLPPSDPPPQPPVVDDGPPSGPLGDLVVAHFRRVEIAMLGRVLITTLAGALPPALVRVEHRRSLGKRLVGRAGEPVGVTVTVGDTALTFRSPAVGTAEASRSHVVHGVVLSSQQVPVAQWLDELGVLLDSLTDDDEQTRSALERALLG